VGVSLHNENDKTIQLHPGVRWDRMHNVDTSYAVCFFIGGLNG